MRNFVLFACLLVLFSAACSKHETGCMPVDPKAEELQITAYAKKDSLHVTRHSSGVYYEIIEPGDGITPNKSSNITVSYVGKFLNDKTFDQGANYSNKLQNLIEGWQIGIPLIKKNGRIKLIIPSSLAYGCNGGNSIPPNSILFFDITLVNSQ